MNNQELNQILSKAQTPEAPAELLARFPGKVTARLQWPRHAGVAGRDALPWKRALGWGLGLAAVAALCFFIGQPKRQPMTAASSPQPTASLQKYLREMQEVFPNQLQGIVFAEDGAHLLLSDKQDVPASPALYLQVCTAQACEKIVTFSGQQVPINGAMCEVLQDGNGRVLVVGEDGLHPERKGHLEARTL